MEPFRASLSSYRLSLVVPPLFDKQLFTGTLAVRRAALERVFSFRDGFLVAASSNEPREHLAQVLSDLGILDLARSAAAFEAARAANVALGTFLVDRGFVDRALLREALSHKALEAFCDCYAWESGDVELAWQEPPRTVGEELRLPLGSLHREGLARLREWRAFREVFPQNDVAFRIHREMGVDGRSERDEQLLGWAEGGANLGELLNASPEGRLIAARRLLQLYRVGALTPKAPKGPRLGEAMDVGRMMDLTRSLLSRGQFESAALVASQALESAAVPEAAALYREAELRMAISVSDKVLGLEGRMELLPLPRPTPGQLTADDLYLYSLLKSARSFREALSAGAMGEVAAYRSIRRLMAAGLIRLTGEGDSAPRRQTNPYGIPVITA